MGERAGRVNNTGPAETSELTEISGKRKNGDAAGACGLPEEFICRMQDLLGEEWEDFFKQTGQDRRYGLRVNTGKIRPDVFEQLAPFHLKKIPWIPNGYYYEREDQPAAHPFYAAGLYYLQEPSAMTPASRLPVCPGDRVLDLCAAPGGKATELAARLAGEGLIVANDINQARARALLRNMELFGIRNSLVTNEPPHILAEKFPLYFDKIMVDAPCSGEGMFRKNPAVMDAWKEKGPDYFSALQREIILHAADMLKPGGLLFYSTCTFAPEENEGVISHLLTQRPQMQVIPMEDYEGFSPGILSFRGMDFHEDCRLTRRIWPHRMGGEGHYLALLRKKEDTLTSLSGIEEVWEHGDPYRRNGHRAEAKACGRNAPGGGAKSSAGKAPLGAVKASYKGKQIHGGKGTFAQDSIAHLTDFFSHISWDIMDKVEIRGDKAYYVPLPDMEDRKLHFLRKGLYLGDLKKGRFEPSEPLALALSADAYDRLIRLPAEDARFEKYLRGESIRIDTMTELLRDSKKNISEKSIKKGWYLLMADDYPLGWGKLTGSTLKNKYPTGWRKRV